MKTEIKIILEDGASNKAKGNCFESLIRNLLSTHQYEVRGNVNFSGMEIDLIATHKHKQDTVYVECKAKEKVSSDELSKFAFNTDYKEADCGYFFRTQELESQAGALLIDLKSKPKYKHLIFFEPKDIIAMLSDANMIFEPAADLTAYSIPKKILAVTYFGDFFIYLINESNVYPTKFIVVSAKPQEKAIPQEDIDILKSRIDDIKNLEAIINYANYSHKEHHAEKDKIIETISEVQESEFWYDYLPASSEKNHFVGRDFIRTQILTFFKEIQTKESRKRIFYLNGKSGWGKSSLVLEIKGRCRNKHYKNKFYAIAIDTRSAISDNFVALALKKLINKAIEENFITADIFLKDIIFTSNVDLLSSNTMNQLLEKLKTEDKFLVLIFDQFEDVFRRKDFFKSFYKFLTDVTDKKPNIIVGFSWKSDFFIQSDDPSYHIWQQAREQAREFTIDAFGEKEIDGIIKQLEESIGELDKSIKDRIKESSQGLPWLTKKLCIHIYDQIKLGLAKENLIESNLNIADLFKKDQERIQPDELKALKLIAKKAYEGDFFDETNVGDLVDGSVISSLLHKRLIIRSGANYNLYWDIFRDYLITGVIPPIGESYLLRQMVNSCIDVFLLFDNTEKRESLSSLTAKHTKGIGEEAIYNILIELRNIGLVQKESDNYFISKDIEISKEGFSIYIKEKLQNYTLYLLLKKENHPKITKDIVLQALKKTFKQDFQDATWEAYANTLLSWFSAAKLDISSKITESKKGRNSKMTSRLSFLDSKGLIPRSSVKETLAILPLLLSDSNSVMSKFYRDLLLIGIIDENKHITDFGNEVISKNEIEQKRMLKQKVILLPKMIQLQHEIHKKPAIKPKELVDNMPDDFFDGNKRSSKVIYASKVLTWLK